MAALVLTTIGSWGDLFPFVGLGRELQRRGHDIRIAASPAWESIVVEAGLRFAPVGRRIGFEEFARHPEIFRRVPFGLRAALRRFLFDQIDLVTDDLRPAIAGADLVVTHPAQLAAQSVATSLARMPMTSSTSPSPPWSRRAPERSS